MFPTRPKQLPNTLVSALNTRIPAAYVAAVAGGVEIGVGDGVGASVGKGDGAGVAAGAGAGVIAGATYGWTKIAVGALRWYGQHSEKLRPEPGEHCALKTVSDSQHDTQSLSVLAEANSGVPAKSVFVFPMSICQSVCAEHVARIFGRVV